MLLKHGKPTSMSARALLSGYWTPSGKLCIHIELEYLFDVFAPLESNWPEVARPAGSIDTRTVPRARPVFVNIWSTCTTHMKLSH
jgi:hypothetical protein